MPGYMRPWYRDSLDGLSHLLIDAVHLNHAIECEIVTLSRVQHYLTQDLTRLCEEPGLWNRLITIITRRKLMSALDNLNTNLGELAGATNALAAAVAAAVPVIAAGKANEPAIQAAADGVAQVSQSLGTSTQALNDAVAAASQPAAPPA